MSHKDLLNLITLYQKDLKKPLTKNGICYGHAYAYMNALLLNQRERFYKRMHLIEEYKAEPERLMEQLSTLRSYIKAHHDDSDFSLSDKDANLLEVAAFFDTILLMQCASELQEIYLDPVTKKYLDTFSITHPACMENPPELVHQAVYAMTQIEFAQHLRKLEHTLSLYGTKTVPIMIDSGVHQIALSWDSEFGRWEYMDINHPEVEPRRLTAAQAAATLTTMEGIRGGQHIVIKADYYCETPEVTLSPMLAHYDQDFSQQAIATRINSDGFTPLHFAARDGLVNLSHTLLHSISRKRETRFNLRTVEKRNTPLSLAVLAGDVETVRLLLQQREIDRNVETEGGLTPLMTVCQRCDEAMLEVMVADPLVEINKPMAKLPITPLLTCVFSGNVTMTQILLSREDLLINEYSHEGYTPLHIAIVQKDAAMVELLLADTRTNINLLTKTKQHPLILAVFSKDPAIVSMLLEKGAIDINSTLFRSAYEQAQSQELSDILTVFNQYQKAQQRQHQLISTEETLARVLAELNELDLDLPIDTDSRRIDAREDEALDDDVYPSTRDPSRFFRKPAPPDKDKKSNDPSQNKGEDPPFPLD